MNQQKLNDELLEASKEGNLKIVKFLLEKGADINTAYEKKWTPLHIAAYFSNLEMVDFLLENGADFNAKCNFDYTPLELANERGHTIVVKYLKRKTTNKSHE